MTTSFDFEWGWVGSGPVIGIVLGWDRGQADVYFACGIGLASMILRIRLS